MSNTAKFRDAFFAGFKVTPVTQSNSDLGNISTKKHVRLSRPSTDYNIFYNNCLVSVNGYYHILDTDGVNGVMVMDAMKTLNYSRKNQIGILDFKGVGSIKTIPFTNSMLLTNSDGTIKINTTQNLTNKTVAISIGGYLRFLDRTTFYQVGTNLFKLDFNNMSFRDMYFESRKYLDLSSLPLEFSPNNSSQITVAQLLSNGNLTEYLKLSQSFLVIIDTPSLEFGIQHVGKTNLPQMFISYKDPIYPLVDGFGRHPSYAAIHEDGQYSITTDDLLTENMVYDTVLNDTLISVANTTRTENPNRYSPSYFLKISKPTNITGSINASSNSTTNVSVASNTTTNITGNTVASNVTVNVGSSNITANTTNTSSNVTVNVSSNTSS